MPASRSARRRQFPKDSKHEQRSAQRTRPQAGVARRNNEEPRTGAGGRRGSPAAALHALLGVVVLLEAALCPTNCEQGAMFRKWRGRSRSHATTPWVTGPKERLSGGPSVSPNTPGAHFVPGPSVERN